MATNCRSSPAAIRGTAGKQVCRWQDGLHEGVPSAITSLDTPPNL